MSTPTPAERPRKRQRVDATRFLDLEATIDYNADADDEEVAASEDGFINDEEEDDAQEHTQHIQLERQLLIENNREHKGLEGESAVDAPDKPLPDLSGHFNLMDDLYAHIRRHKHQTTSAASILASGSFEGAEGHPAGQLEAWGVPVGSNWDVYNELESRLPRREDMLFEIPCKVCCRIYCSLFPDLTSCREDTRMLLFSVLCFWQTLQYPLQVAGYLRLPLLFQTLTCLVASFSKLRCIRKP